MSNIPGAAISARTFRAHALKNCLSVVNAVNRLMEAEVSEPSQDRLLRSQSAVRRMTELIDEELPLASHDLGAMDPQPLSAGQIMDAVRVRAEDLAAVRRVDLLFRIATGGLRGDLHALAEAIGNLVVSAIESTSSGGAVVVTSSQSAGGGQVWTVRDTGPGIPPRLLQCFGPPCAATSAEDVGIGIAITRAIVEQHGGSLRIDSSLGSGTIASVLLPAASELLAAAGI